MKKGFQTIILSTALLTLCSCSIPGIEFSYTPYIERFPDTKPIIYTFKKDEINLRVGDTETISLFYVLEPIDPKKKDDVHYYEYFEDIRWQSSDNSVAKVNNGKITAKSAGGAVITAYADNDHYASINVFVGGDQVQSYEELFTRYSTYYEDKHYNRNQFEKEGKDENGYTCKRRHRYRCDPKPRGIYRR